MKGPQLNPVDVNESGMRRLLGDLASNGGGTVETLSKSDRTLPPPIFEVKIEPELAGMFLSSRASATDDYHFGLGGILRQALKVSLFSRYTQFAAVTVTSLPYLGEEILISIPSED